MTKIFWKVFGLKKHEQKRHGTVLRSYSISMLKAKSIMRDCFHLWFCFAFWLCFDFVLILFCFDLDVLRLICFICNTFLQKMLGKSTFRRLVCGYAFTGWFLFLFVLIFKNFFKHFAERIFNMSLSIKYDKWKKLIS